MRLSTLLPLLSIFAILLPGGLMAAPDSDALLKVLRAAHFKNLAHVADLPPAVLRACVNDPEHVAEPGGPFNPTDVKEPGDSRPTERLVWAATDGEHYVAEFEYGGISHYRSTLMVSFDNSTGKAKALAVAHDVNASDVDELIKAASASTRPFWSEPGRYH